MPNGTSPSLRPTQVWPDAWPSRHQHRLPSSLSSSSASSSSLSDPSSCPSSTSSCVDSSELPVFSTENASPVPPPPNWPQHDYNGLTLTWNNVTCWIKPTGIRNWIRSSRQPRNYILKSVPGIALPGELLGILGTGGSGKTTLLRVLMRHHLSGVRIDGVVRVNGRNLGAQIQRVSNYLPQDLELRGCLTVREHLIFHSQLRLSDQMYSRDAKLQRVHALMKELGLEKVAERRIDHIYHFDRGGLSGSERKLVGLASQLMTEPGLVVLDEPLTGLDESMATMVVQHLSSMASRGTTVLCTLHQPSSGVFHQFHRILLLAQGRLIFHGKREDADIFFMESGFPCPVNYNPADHFIYTTAIEASREEDGLARVTYLEHKFRESRHYEELRQGLAMGTPRDSGSTGNSSSRYRPSPETNSYPTSWWRQLTTLLWKCSLEMLRDRRTFLSQFIQNLLSMSLLSALFFHQEYDQIGVFNMNASLFHVVSQVAYLAHTSLRYFMENTHEFYNDHLSRLYRPSIFFLTRNVLDGAMLLVQVMLCSLVTYWSIGLYSSVQHFMQFAAILVLVYQAVLALVVYTLGVLCSRVEMVLVLLPGLHMISWLLAGHLVNDATLPQGLAVLRYLSLHRYGYELLQVNQWLSVDSIQCSWPTSQNTDQSDEFNICFENGSDVLQFWNFSSADVVFNVIVLISLGLALRGIVFLLLHWKCYRK